MKDNNDLKIAIRKLEQGKFQNLCNKILFCMGYENINQLGSHDESDRTTPGTPDTYILKCNKYILVEYTVQKTGLYQKVLEDIEKCLNKISMCNIKKGKIFYFHTSSNMKMEQFKQLNDLCKNSDVKLKIYNVDMIANLLKEKYPLIAKEFLGIEVDTLQILSSKSFLEEYNSAISSVKINKTLLFREQEKTKIIESIQKNEITLISGKSGVGKTHLVLDLLINSNQALKGYEIFCIKNRNKQLFDDLKKYLTTKKKYIIFIDDINNINGLDQILYFLEPINNLNLKIVATVRDYAKNKVIDKVNEIEEKTKRYFEIDFVKIEPLSDEQLTEIIKTETDIKNEMNIRNILSVSQNNARLMMMTVNVLIKGENKKKYKIEEIYDIYYKDMINHISFEHPNIMKSLAAISIVNAIDISNDEHKKIIDLFNIELKDFKNDMQILHNNEIIDMIDENIAKVSEQCLSNYSIFLSIIVNRDIKLSDLIILMFPKHVSRLTEDINMLFNVFNSNEILKLVEENVKLIWNEIDKYSINKIDFLESFGQMLELETLDYCLEYVNSLEYNRTKIDYSQIVENKNKEYPEDKILNLLGIFKYSSNINNVLNIISEYLKKDNSIISDVYKLFAYKWGFGDEIYYNDFHIQESIIDSLISMMDDSSENVTYLVLNLIKQYLKTHGDYTKPAKKRSITIIQYSLCECIELRNFRNKMLDFLKNLCKDEKNKNYVLDVLDNLYSSGYGKKENIKLIIENDKTKIFDLIKLLGSIDFSIAIVIDKITKKYDYFEIKYKKPQINNSTFSFYKLLISNIDDDFVSEQTVKNMKQVVSKMNTSNIENYIKEISLIESEKTLENDYNINRAISSFLNASFEKKDVNRNGLLKICITNSALKNFPIENILKLCIEQFGYNEVKKILTELDFKNKFYFMITCYSLIPIENISKKELDELINFISNKIELTKGYSINLSFLDKYIAIDKNIYPKVVKIICEIYNDDMFVFSLYTSLLFNKYSENTPEKLKKLFASNYETLINTYLLSIRDRDNSDYDGTYFKMFLEIDSNLFIDKYIDFLLDHKSNIHYSHDGLKYIWSESDNIIEYTISKILKLDSSKRESLLEKLFCNSKETFQKEEKYLKQQINNFIDDKEKIIELFSIIAKKSKECRINCICEFLKISTDIELFKKLQLESYSWSWSGSEVPIVDKRIDYFVELSKKIEELGIKYIKHNLYIKEKADCLKKRKKDIIRKEFLEDWY